MARKSKGTEVHINGEKLRIGRRRVLPSVSLESGASFEPDENPFLQRMMGVYGTDARTEQDTSLEGLIEYVTQFFKYYSANAASNLLTFLEKAKQEGKSFNILPCQKQFIIQGIYGFERLVHDNGIPSNFEDLDKIFEMLSELVEYQYTCLRES